MIHALDLEAQPLLSRYLSPSRLAHSQRVAHTAYELAIHWNLDSQAAYQAGLLHDLAKPFSPSTLPHSISDSLTDVWESYPAVWHALVGPAWINSLPITPLEGVLEAIYWHTTGGDCMSCLTQVLFVADYIEPQRPFGNRQMIAELAQSNLQHATLAVVGSSIHDLLRRGLPIHPFTIDCYNWVCGQLGVSVSKSIIEVI